LNSLIVLVMQPLVQLSCIVRESIRQKYVQNVQGHFWPLNNPTEIAEYILNELFETLFDNGIKNIQ